MVFSLWASIDAADFWNSGFLILFPTEAVGLRNFRAVPGFKGCHAGVVDFVPHRAARVSANVKSKTTLKTYIC